jgi:hypothetical protein
MSVAFGGGDALGDALDAFRVRDGGATVLLHDKSHACALLESGVGSL